MFQRPLKGFFSEAAETLFADSLDGLQAAKAKAPAGGTAAKLIVRVLYALDTQSGTRQAPIGTQPWPFDTDFR